MFDQLSSQTQFSLHHMRRASICFTLGVALTLLPACSTTQSVQDTTVATSTSTTTTITADLTTTTTTSIVAPQTTTAPATNPPATTIAKKKTATTVADPRSAAEIASAFASSVSDVVDNLLTTGTNVGHQKMDAIWAKYKSLGATLAWYDSALSPSSGTNAEFASNYRIALRGESFCYKNTASEPDYKTVYVSTAC